jgi:hypothetical protein
MWTSASGPRSHTRTSTSQPGLPSRPLRPLGRRPRVRRRKDRLHDRLRDVADGERPNVDQPLTAILWVPRPSAISAWPKGASGRKEGARIGTVFLPRMTACQRIIGNCAWISRFVRTVGSVSLIVPGQPPPSWTISSPRLSDHVIPQSIALHVTTNGHETPVLLNGERLETALVQRPGPGGVVVGVPTLGVRHRQPAHEFGKIAVLLWPDDQMPVIGDWASSRSIACHSLPGEGPS